MRETNEKVLNTGIYARIRALPINSADREDAIQALEQAERFANLLVAIQEKLEAIGSSFLKPSLKH
jgi:hypothetical protein